MAPSPAKSNRASATKKVAAETRPTQQKLAATAKPKQKATSVAAKPASRPAKSVAKSPAKPPSKAPVKAVTKSVAKDSVKEPAKAATKPVGKPVAAKPAAKPAPVKGAAKVAASRPSAAKVPQSVPKAPAKPAPKASQAKPAPVAEVKASRLVRTKPASKVPSVAPLAQRAPKKSRVARSSDAKSKLLSGELPQEYGVDRLVAIPKDPEWTHLYWEVSPETRQEMPSTEGMLRLRGFDTTGLYFDGTNAPVALDIEVAPFARSWYAKLPYQGRVYTFEYGWITPQGEWKGVARSQPVGFEPGMAQVGSQEEWISIASEELFRAAAGLGDGEGIQDLIRKLRERSAGSHLMGGAAWLTSWGSGMGRMELAPSSWAPSSAEFLQLPSSWSNTSMGSQVHWSGLSSGEFQPPKNRQKDFWLWVETELVLYGATEPDAQVTLMGRPLQLNPDGTFRVKFPFPHGTELKMDVRAVDRDGDQVREVKPAARRWTD